MGDRRRGRHRAPRKPVSRFVLPTLLVTLLPISIALGYVNLTTDTATQINSVDPYAGTITIAASPLDLPTTTASPTTHIPSPAEIRGTNHTTPPTTEPQRPSESDTGSTESTQAPTTTRQKDAKPAQTSSAPVPPTQKVKESSKCANLDSDESVVITCNAIMAEFPNVSSMGGRAQRPENPTSCHPLGQGLDVMVDSNELGDTIYAWLQDRTKELGISYLIWEEPDHWNHVHISFEPCKG